MECAALLNSLPLSYEFKPMETDIFYISFVRLQKFRFLGDGDCPDWLLAEINTLSRMVCIGYYIRTRFLGITLVFVSPKT